MVKRVGIVFAAAIIAASFVFAHGSGKKSHETHGCMAACAEHHSAAIKASDEIVKHLAEAKSAATPAEMRSHIEMAETSMTEMKKHMSMCMESCGMHSDRKALGKVVDPVCGMDVDPAISPKAIHAGKTYYFCSDEEKANFQKNPQQYAGKS
jgi:YHS domain-containing protein